MITVERRFWGACLLAGVLLCPVRGLALEARTVPVRDLGRTLVSPMSVTCGDGVLAVADYGSAAVVLLSPDGEVRREVHVETGSGKLAPLAVAFSGRDWVAFYPDARLLVEFGPDWQIRRREKAVAFHPFGALGATPEGLFFSGSIRRGDGFDMTAVLSYAERATLQPRALWLAGDETDRNRLKWSEQEGVIARTPEGHILSTTFAVPEVREYGEDGRLVRIYDRIIPESRRLSGDPVFSRQGVDPALARRWYDGAEIPLGLVGGRQEVVAITKRGSEQGAVWTVYKLQRDTGKLAGSGSVSFGEGFTSERALFCGDPSAGIQVIHVGRHPAGDKTTTMLHRINVRASDSEPATRGRALAPDGTPLQGAMVLPAAAGGRVMATGAATAAKGGAPARADEGGFFAVPASWGDQLLVIDPRGRPAVVDVTAMPAPLVVQLQQGPSVSIAVTRGEAAVTDADSKQLPHGVRVLCLRERDAVQHKELLAGLEGFAVPASGRLDWTLADGRNRCSVEAPGFLPQERIVEVSEGAVEPASLFFGLQEAGEILLRVRRENGRPMENGRAFLLPENDPLVRAPRPSPQPLDSAGEVIFHQVAERSRSRVVVVAPGYAPAVLRSLEPGSEYLEVVLDDGLSVSGLVVDPAGEPIADVQVLVRQRPPDFAEIGFQQSSRTEEAGGFAVAGLVASQAIVQFRKDGLATVQRTIELDTSPFMMEAVEMAPGRTVAGQIRIRGNPIDDAEIRAAEMDLRTKSRAGGLFELAGLPRSEVTLDVSHPSARPVRRQVPFPLDGPLLIELDAGSSIAGRVVDGWGDPVGGSRIALHAPVGTTFHDAGPDGRLQLGGLAAGDYRLEVSAPGLAATELQVSVPAAGEVDLGDVVLKEGLGLGGQVVDESTGLPVAGVEVEAVPVHALAHMERLFGTARSVLTEADGRFQLGGLDAGVVDLHVRKAGYAPTSLPGVEVRADEATWVEVELGVGHTISGHVAGCDEEPLSGVTVSVRTAGALGAVRSATTDAGGQFEIAGVANGPAVVFLGAGGGTASGEPVRLPDDARRSLRLSACRAAVEGWVLVDGEPVAGGTVFLQAEQYGASSGVLPVFLQSEGDAVPGMQRIIGELPPPPQAQDVDSNGRFWIPMLDAGRYRARYLGTQGEMFEENVEIPAGKQAQIVLAWESLSISGDVVSVDNARPEGGAVVYLDGPAGRRETMSQSDGRFDFNGVSPGSYTLVASGRDGSRAVLESVVVPSRGDVTGLRLALRPPGGRRLLRILSPAGNVVPFAVVVLRSSAADGIWRLFQADASGVVRVEDFPPGPAVPCVVAAGFGAGCYPPWIVAAGDEEEHELRLPAGGSLSGSVDTAIPAGTRLLIQDQNGENISRVLEYVGMGVAVGFDGRFHIEGLAPGTYLVGIHLAGAVVQREAHVQAGGTAELQFSLE